jgi:hypothetical protein
VNTLVWGAALCQGECGLWSFDATSDRKVKEMCFDATNVAFGAGQ